MSDQVSELDPEHWLYDNIVFAMWPADGEGKQHHDAKTGKVYSSSGTMSAGNRGIDENGEHLKLTPSSALSSAHYINIGQPPELEALNDEITILVGYKRTDDQDSGYGRLVCRTNGSTGDHFGLAQETQSAGSNLRWRVNNGGGGSTNIYSTSAMSLNEYHDIAVTIDDPNNLATISVDGVQEASSGGVDIVQGYDTAIGTNSGSSTRNLYGDIYYVIILNKALTENEIAKFTENVDSVRKSNVIDFRKVSTVVDTTAPVLSSPTGTKTGSTTADGTVSTDEDNGTLYYLATENATETAATIKAGSNQAVSGTGVQDVSFISLNPSTTYYAHYLHVDVATNESNAVHSASFITDSSVSGIPIFRRRIEARKVV